MYNSSKKIKFIFTIAFVFIFFFMSKKLYAMTQDEVGKTIATFAINFQKSDKGGKICTYHNADLSTIISERKSTYNGTPNANGQFLLECVGWANLCMHLSIGMDHPSVSNGTNGFIMPTDCYNHNTITDYFERVTGPLKPGDLIINSHHIMVYVGKIDGKDRIVHSDGTPLSYDTFEEYAAKNNNQSDNPIDGVYTEAYRVTKAYAEKVDKKNTRTTWDGSSGNVNWDNGTGEKITWTDYLIKQAKKCHDFVRDKKMVYDADGSGTAIPPTGTEIDCSSYVSYVLYECGFADMAGAQHTSRNSSLGAYGKEKGWERITDVNKLQPRRYLLF